MRHEYINHIAKSLVSVFKYKSSQPRIDHSSVPIAPLVYLFKRDCILSVWHFVSMHPATGRANEMRSVRFAGTASAVFSRRIYRCRVCNVLEVTCQCIVKKQKKTSCHLVWPFSVQKDVLGCIMVGRPLIPLGPTEMFFIESHSRAITKPLESHSRAIRKPLHAERH